MTSSASSPPASQAQASASAPASPDIIFSSNSDPELLAKDLEPLLRSAGSGGRWRLTVQRSGLERSFKFKTFKKTWEFMNVIAAECAVKKHHPEWSNVYNTTFIRWTTHSPPGLSAKDITMAAFCDAQAAAFGEVIPDEWKDDVEIPETGTAADSKPDGGDDVGRQLADRVALAGADCCVPKGKK